MTASDIHLAREIESLMQDLLPRTTCDGVNDLDVDYAKAVMSLYRILSRLSSSG